MITVRRLLLAAVTALLIGCMKETPAPGDGVTRVGFLAEMQLQHPIVSGGGPESTTDQFYFDLGDEPRSMNQIIVVHPVAIEPPRERGRKIELSGSVEEFSFEGGGVGKMGYRNEVLTLRSWRYLE